MLLLENRALIIQREATYGVLLLVELLERARDFLTNAFALNIPCVALDSDCSSVSWLDVSAARGKVAAIDGGQQRAGRRMQGPAGCGSEQTAATGRRRSTHAAVLDADAACRASQTA